MHAPTGAKLTSLDGLRSLTTQRSDRIPVRRKSLTGHNPLFVAVSFQAVHQVTYTPATQLAERSPCTWSCAHRSSQHTLAQR